MALKIRTVMTYPLNGSTVDFGITFEYLARKFVSVTLIGKDRKELVLNQDFRFITKTQITTTRAWGTSDGYTMIEIRRFTSATERLVDFSDGSILRAYDLNIAQVQTLHVAEEARDLTADTIGVNNDGNLDARGRRIVNLANAVDDGDAISFGQVKTMNQNSWQARNESLQFRNEAETFRNQAEGFKNESDTNATNTYKWRNEAEGFRDEAERFKNTATQQAAAAGNSASAAHQSEVNAANSAADSANSATLAEQQADRAEREADKLGNWNALTGAIEEVSPEHVVSWAAGAKFGGEMYFMDSMHCYQGLLVEGYGKPLAVTNQANTTVATFAYGPGDLTQGSWVCNTRWSFYDSGVEIGWVRGDSLNGHGLIRWKPEGSQETVHDILLNPDGEVKFQSKISVGGASVGPDGNIGGSIWGEHLAGWLRENTINRIVMGEANYSALFRTSGVEDGGGKVITALINSYAGDTIDACRWRVMQYVRNDGQRFNIY